jgi:molybdopterin/thiamine biosynthesis adenylyltransferase
MGVEEADAAPQSTPDDEIAAVLGRTLLHALRSKKLLLVGAGGIGCEILKDLLSMGIGKITVADNQKLSPDNLPGQFLYQPTDVNVPKPLAAVSSIRKYWGEATVDTCLDKNFSLQICEKHDIILSGVHSSARTNLDPLIVSSKLPWIDCGSDGMLGHIQPVVPFLTETYCSQRDMPLQDQPMDGITMRPNHYMVANWATLACIDREFDSVAHLVNAYLDNPSCYDHNADTLEKVRLFLSKRETTIEDCIQFGRALFEACFVLNTKTLMQAFPINCKTHSGEWFWKAERRPTIPVEYDAGDEDHVEFVASAAYLKGFMTGVIDENSKPPNWNEIKDSIREATRHTTYPDLDALPKVTPTVATVVAIKSQMPQVDSLKHWRMKYVKPNYRDHSGFHVDLAVAACLIRCRALAISAEPRSYWLKFLTSSTPSLISTSATVAGLGCLELIKLAHSTYAPKPLQSTFLNLHTGDIIPSEPAKPETMTFAGASFNIWSSIEIHGKGMTVLDILTHFLTNYQIEVEIISVGPSLIYGAFAGTYKQRLNMLLTEAVSQGTGKPLSDYRGRFELDIVAVDSLTGEDINDIPSIVVFYE